MANMLPILLMMRSAQQTREREARRRREEEDRRRRLRREEENRKRSSYSRQVGRNKGYSSNEYLYKLVSEDKALVKFFDLVDEKTTEIIKREDTQDLLEIQELLKVSTTEIEKIRDIEQRLVKSGISLSADTVINGGAIGVKTSHGYGFGGVGEYGYNRLSFPATFNGITLKREDLEENSPNPYEDDYVTCRAATENLPAEKERIEKAISRKELFLKLSPFGRDNARRELFTLKQKLSDVESAIEDGVVRKGKMDAYAALTPEQKVLIKEYYDAIDKYKPIGKNISERIDDNIQKGKRYGKYRELNQSIWEQAITELIAEGKLTQEDVRGVEEKLASFEIEDRRYDEGISESVLSNGRRDYTSLVRYFYNKPMIEQKRKELIEKRAKKAELEDEEKVISETEDLAKSVKNDKTKKTEDEQK